MIGRCRLCLEERELQFSHLLPRALYRLVGSASDQAHPDTVQITIGGRKKSSEQARRHILCACCEERFNSKGERWTLRNCYRGKGRFRLRTEVRSRKPLESELGIEAYSTSEEELAHLVYFCLSVVWRASLCDWPHRGRNYESIDLGPYQEEIRKFLNDEGEIPTGVALTIILFSTRQTCAGVQSSGVLSRRSMPLSQISHTRDKFCSGGGQARLLPVAEPLHFAISVQSNFY